MQMTPNKYSVSIDFNKSEARQAESQQVAGA